MTLRYALTKDDLAGFYFYAGWSSPAKKRYRQLYFLRVLLSSCIGAVIVLLIWWRPVNVVKILFFAIPFVLLYSLLLTYFAIHVSYKKKIRKLVDDPGNASALLPSEVQFTETGIFTRDERTEAKFNWQSIIKKSETAGYYYLFVSSVQAIIVPKRILDANSKQALEKLLAQHISLEAEFNDVYSS
ncbi:MAG TPA: YcxB family protein [Flavisolibacter sp.]|nr:YcxB family protein [Flavisolibacter sp.]